jgi:hypothetical protein
MFATAINGSARCRLRTIGVWRLLFASGRGKPRKGTAIVNPPDPGQYPAFQMLLALAGSPCITRGRCGSLRLHRGGLTPPTFRRSPGAPVHSIKTGPWEEARGGHRFTESIVSGHIFLLICRCKILWRRSYCEINKRFVARVLDAMGVSGRGPNNVASSELRLLLFTHKKQAGTALNDPYLFRSGMRMPFRYRTWVHRNSGNRNASFGSIAGPHQLLRPLARVSEHRYIL